MPIADFSLNKRWHIRTQDWPLPGELVTAGCTDDLERAKVVFESLSLHPAVTKIFLMDQYTKEVIREKTIVRK